MFGTHTHQPRGVRVPQRNNYYYRAHANTREMHVTDFQLAGVKDAGEPNLFDIGRKLRTGARRGDMFNCPHI